MSVAPIKLVTNPTASEEVKESVVRLLRDTLTEAEAGQIDCVAIIIGRVDGQWLDRCSTTMCFSEAIGRLEITKQEWIEQYLRNR